MVSSMVGKAIMMRRSRPWIEEDIKKLLAAVDAGATKFRAAGMLRRTAATVQNKARMLGKPFKTVLEAKREMPEKETAATKNL